MMRKRGIIVLLVAVLLGGIAVVLVNSILKPPEKPVGNAAAAEMVQVVVAAVNIETGARLTTVNVRSATWLKESLPDGAFTDIDKLLEKEPPVLIRDVHKGEPILPYKLSGHGTRAVLAVKVPETMRAIAILVNEVRGVAGFVLPGDRVDVLATAALDKEKRQFVTRTLVQNVTVLGVDQVSSETEEQPKVVNAVTLLVNKQQGELLTLAQSVGELTLLLRNESDVAESDQLSGVALADLKLNTARYVTPVRRIRSARHARSGGYLDVQVFRGINPTTYSVKKGDSTRAVPIRKGGEQ